MVDAEIRRLSRHLEALLRLRKVPIRALERQLGFGGGTMNRIFSGKIELKVRHVLLILETLDIEPARFFHHVYAEPDKPLDDEQVLKTAGRMNRRRPEQEPEGDAEPTVSMSELQAAVLQVLENIGIDPRGGHDKKPRKKNGGETKESGAGKEEPPAKAARKQAKKPAKRPRARKPPADADSGSESP